MRETIDGPGQGNVEVGSRRRVVGRWTQQGSRTRAVLRVVVGRSSRGPLTAVRTLQGTEGPWTRGHDELTISGAK